MCCRDCWDEALAGKELCEWCEMTPEQRTRKLRRSWALVLLASAAVALALIFG